MNNNDLKPVYLVVGSDKLKQKTVIERLESRLSNICDLSINSSIFDGSTNSAQEILNYCNTVPFLSEKKLVRINNAERIRSDEFIDYIKHPNSYTVMLLMCDKLAKNTKLYRSIDPNCIIKCDLPKAYQFTSVIESIARKNNVSISIPAAQRLIKLSGQDTILIDNQINKIKLATSKNKIELQDIIDNVENSNEPKPWDFVDAFAEKNVHKCLNLYSQMTNKPEFVLLSLTCSRVKELICAKCLNEGQSAYDLAKIVSKQAWQVKNHINNAKQFRLSELNLILNNALNCEVKLKSSINTQDVMTEFIVCSLKNKRTNIAQL